MAAHVRRFGDDLSNRAIHRAPKGKAVTKAYLPLGKASPATVKALIPVASTSPVQLSKEDANEILLAAEECLKPLAVTSYSKEFLLSFREVCTGVPGGLPAELLRGYTSPVSSPILSRSSSDTGHAVRAPVSPVLEEEVFVSSQLSAASFASTVSSTRSLSASQKKIKKQEEDEQKLAGRQKQIDIGKSTGGYKKYLLSVPTEERGKEHPRTPNKLQKCSKRCWDAQIRRWRRALHEFDELESEDPTQLGASNVSASSTSSASSFNDSAGSMSPSVSDSEERLKGSESPSDGEDSTDEEVIVQRSMPPPRNEKRLRNIARSLEAVFEPKSFEASPLPLLTIADLLPTSHGVEVDVC